MQEGCTPKRPRIEQGLRPLRCVEYQLDRPILDGIDDIRPALRGLEDRFGGNPALDQEPLGARGRDDLEAEPGEQAQGLDDARLVSIANRHEYRAGAGQPRAAADLALDEGDLARAIDAHHLAGGAHLRAEHGVDTGET